MRKHIETIIEQFSAQWRPQAISVAENVFSRFIAGETILELQHDYDLNTSEIESAIRFFALKWKGNARARKLYDDWQKRRWQETGGKRDE